MPSRRPLLLAAAFTLTGCAGTRCAVKDDEQAQLFPTYASRSGDQWTVPVHGRIYTPRAESELRSVGLSVAGRLLGKEEETAVLRDRIRSFWVSGEKSRRVDVELSGETYRPAKSDDFGHFQGSVRTAVAPAAPSDPTEPRWLEYRIAGCGRSGREFKGKAVLLEGSGLSVVTEIDALRPPSPAGRMARAELVLFQELTAQPGMPEAYERWARQGAAFHYLSDLPWQLFPEVSRLLDGLPPGSVELRRLDWEGTGRVSPLQAVDRLLEALSGSRQQLTASLDDIMKRFPDRGFVLIGDGGGVAPEAFAAVARRHPRQVRLIAVRTAPDTELKARQALGGLPEGSWMLFEEPGQMPRAAPPPR